MRRSAAVMGTVVTIQASVPRSAGTDDVSGAIDRAFGWFLEVESTCTRFDERSELRRLLADVGRPVRVSGLLGQAVQFALAMAEASGGAFDPTVGRAMELRGFDREHRTGRRIATPEAGAAGVTFRDVHVDAEAGTVTIDRPLLLDLGAVAKGLAIDLAIRELRPYADFAVDAGGDLYLGGLNPDREPWRVGIRHPREAGATIAVVSVSDAAVCTSGDYERHGAGGSAHIFDPRRESSGDMLASATVVAPAALAADALATAAFVLGPEAGLRLLDAQAVEGLLVTTDLSVHRTPAFPAEARP